MKPDFTIGPYDPCPCGSGTKYKWCCAAKAKENRHGKYPIGTVCFYGPDDKTTTKITAGVVLSEEDDDPVLERFVGTNVVGDPKVGQQIKQFFARHGVKSVAVSDGNMGCPHEEGEDYPDGGDCPFCPFWAGKQGTAAVDEDADDDQEQPPASDEDEADFSEDDFNDAVERMEAVIGDDALAIDQAVDRLFAHLSANLQFPCRVTSVEWFNWEEAFLEEGEAEPSEAYQRLRQTRPSGEDEFDLLSIDRGEGSKWMRYVEDICARVRRVSDGREFVVGLGELTAGEEDSLNGRLLYDYFAWLTCQW